MPHRDDPASARPGKDADGLRQEATRNPATQDASKRDAGHDKRDRDLIGQNLRRVYDEVASEPLPDRFKDLLDQLKKGER